MALRLSTIPAVAPQVVINAHQAPTPTKPTPVATHKIKKIAIEEAFATPELLAEWQKILDAGAVGEPGFKSLYAPFLKSPATRDIREKLLDVGLGRIHEMDQHGIDIQVLSITAPGVQMFSPEKAVNITERVNDQLAEFVSAYPNRYIGLATIAPQVPEHAASELERAIKDLDMRGAIINSHTQGEYLDHPKFWSIFEAAQALDVPIYLHPRTPSPAMIAPFLSYGLEGAGWGFAAETSLHAIRLILSGVFDYFPKLKLILGHMGEGIPFWLPRMDSHFANKTWTDLDISGKVKKLQKAPSEYFMDNFVIATSGMNWSPAIMFAVSVLGAERILFAIDYPYESTAHAVEGLDNTPLSEADREKIYQLNAEKLFKLTPTNS